MDSLKLELLKNKQEHAQSAIASQEVREHLAGFIRSKRQGSACQINNIQLPSGHHLNNFGYRTAQANSGGSNNYASHYVNNLISEGSQEDDHPLRKTASMPTMHIPYKAQSLSRRRQMERRTTMSPLMRRKSKPKRQLLHSHDSSSTEYSSNPCIIQSTQTMARSLSQSSSPPPPVQQRPTVQMGITSTDTGAANQQISATPSSTPSSNLISAAKTSTTSTTLGAASCQQPSESTSSPSSQAPHSSNTNINQTAHKSNSSSSSSINNNNNNNDLQMDQNALRHKQHLKVNEAIRKTVIQRASNRGRSMASGGSLDMEVTVSAGGSGETGTETKGGNLSGGFGDELRQWSLDGADLRTNAALNKLSGTTLSGGLFHRDFHKLRLATTKDAAILRRSQSPSSSISMGLTSGQATARIAQQQSHNILLGQHTMGASGQVTSIVNVKQYSSSSSSTSSLLSQQDSLEDSSSQAIDLSSSSEASRRHHHTSAKFGSNAHRAQIASQLINCTSTSLASKANHQKVLQESFNQLQLCQSQEGINQYLMPSQKQQQAAPLSQHHTVQRGDSSSATCHHHHHPPSLVDASKTASLDATVSQHQHLLVSLSKQFNLSASAQNLISIQDNHFHRNQQHNLNQHKQQLLQQHHYQSHNNSGICGQQQNIQLGPILAHQQQHDLNQLMLAYKNLVQTPDGQQTGNQISSALVANMANFPEAYKSSLLSHLIQQQQQQQFQTCNTLADVSYGSSTSGGRFARAKINSHAHAGQYHQDQEPSLDQRSLISRALSSPLLASSEVSMNVDLPLQSDNLQDQVMCCDDRITLQQPQQQQPDIADVELISSRIDPRVLIRSGGLGDSIIEDNHSLDLTTSSRSSKSSGGNKGEMALNFNYTPVDPKKTSCNFIYNPVFDKNSSTGLIYELEMCNHKCICGDENNHPENFYRILAIWRRLYDIGLMAKCAKIDGRKASLEEIQLCHSETYSYYFGKGPYERLRLNQLDLSKLPIEGLTQLECGGQGADIDTAWNEEQTPAVARLAAGCAIEAAVSVANGKLMNAFAIVRPPGHHAEFQQAMGFCFFNSVAIAARVLISKHQLARVLIVDWDVHHGNGIQKMFYDDKRVMYISLHRHDKGNFFPGTGDIKETGVGIGEGYNWNIAWSGESMGDAEYLAAFRCLVMPIAIDYKPSMVLVACGFDAARGHPFNFGGYDLSPACFAYMTRQLMSLANGRLVLCLEGGYQLNTICDCAESCVRALLNESHSCPADQVSESELRREPNQSASEVLFEVSSLAAKYWPNVERWRCAIDKSALEAANVR